MICCMNCIIYSTLLVIFLASQAFLTEVDIEQVVLNYCHEFSFRSVILFDSRPTILHVARSLARQGLRVAVTNELDPNVGPETLTMLYFGGTAALSLLIKAGRNRGFGPGKHWLIITPTDLHKAALRELASLPVLLDSDVVLGVTLHNGDMKMYEVYNAGRQIVTEIGGWYGTKLDVRGLKSYKYFRRGDLSSLQLRACAVGVNKMYFQYTGSRFDATVTGGYAGNIFLALKDVLKLNVAVHVLEGYAFGLYSQENDSWSGLVGELQRRDCDISACEVSPTFDRHRHLDFTVPFQIVGRRLYYRRPEKEFHADSFLRPFSFYTWIAVSASLPLLAIVAFLLGRWEPGVFSRRHDDASFGHAFLNVLYAALLQGWPHMPRDVPRRIIMWTAYACYLVVSVSYSSKMVSMRTAEKPNLPISSLQDVLDQKEWAFGFVGGALERNFFQGAEPETLLGKLWRERVLKSPNNLVNDPKSGLQRALDARYVFLGFHWTCQESLRSQFTAEQACQIHVSNGETYFQGGLSFGLPKYSPLLEPINYWMIRMRETGIMSRMETESMPRSHVCEAAPFASVTIKDVAPALLLLGVGIIVSLFILALEILWKWRSRRKQMTYN